MTDPQSPPSETLLRELGKDARLIPQQATNFESPLELLDQFLTPIERFYVRSNGPVSVDIDPGRWRLAVTGLVERELELSLADLKALPQQSVTAFLECSGNSRSRFPATPAKVEGTNWGNGAVGNASWTGVSLVSVLKRAGVKPEAAEVVSQGADFENMRRGLPLEVALNPDVMLVWGMNGEELPSVHGGPVRLLVPGWGAIASTKWLIGLELIDHPFDGFYNTDNYVLYDESGAAVGPVSLMPVQSLITSPSDGAVLAAGSQVISGFAWSGYGGIASVDIDTGDGAGWSEARIVETAGPLSWARFETPWDAQPGARTLRSRATDTHGHEQPDEATWNAKGHQMNAIPKVHVTVS